MDVDDDYDDGGAGGDASPAAEEREEEGEASGKGAGDDRDGEDRYQEQQRLNIRDAHLECGKAWNSYITVVSWGKASRRRLQLCKQASCILLQ